MEVLVGPAMGGLAKLVLLLLMAAVVVFQEDNRPQFQQDHEKSRPMAMDKQN